MHTISIHYGKQWLSLVSKALGEECPRYLFTGKASFPRGENRALREGFPKSRSSTQGRVNAVGGQPTPFPSFLKKILSQVQHSGKTPSFPSAAA
jgi:hypothetical protein